MNEILRQPNFREKKKSIYFIAHCLVTLVMQKNYKPIKQQRVRRNGTNSKELKTKDSRASTEKQDKKENILEEKEI
ncbi:CLUMA_CG006437, isoform A [Clunio marinus]|uniref:CLUMA_CG006437, isoform A n=1 Tax=Clunio marinus TaxID=568069 RepID=A0A1J1HXP4_9DIPT|nr:CLUMA_CG006437, isoform A [Clunio marinus]